MSRIEIRERDFTTPIAMFDTTDVAFIPGFVNPNTSAEAERGVPILCKSLAEFSKYFGSTAPIFEANQPYPEAFSVAARVNLTGNMFNAGDADPSYIYARELLSQGLPVVYERMNVSSQDITVSCAYEYFSNLVFTQARPDVIVYPTIAAWDNTSAYSIGTIVAYNNISGTPGGGSGISPTGSGQEPTYYNTDTARAYVCIAAISAPAAGEENEGPDGTQASAQWRELERYQDTNNPLMDLGLSVKFITSGGYPTMEYASDGITGLMYGIAGTDSEGRNGRGDCVALIDYLDNPNRKFVGTGSIYEASQSITSEYAAIFAPWVEVGFTNTYTGTSNNHMPPSFAYLTALANALKYSSNTNAIAGVNRGLIPNLKSLCSNYVLTNTIAEDDFQPDQSGVSVNGITNIRNYGYRIWGNRTTKPVSGGTTATCFLNIRNMVSDIKKTVYSAAMVTLFEPNAQLTWINFTSKITPFLDTLVSNYGITRYQIDRVTTQDNGMPFPKTVMAATITIYPIYSIEKIKVTIAIRDDDTVDISE